MHVQKTWDGIMNAPVRLDDIVLAEMLWAAFKALFTVTAILGVMLALGISHSPKLLLAWPVLLGVGITFSCHCADLQCAGQGVRLFHLLLHAVPHADDVPERHLLPAGAVAAAGANHLHWLPLTNAVELVRPLFMDQWPSMPCSHAAGAGWSHGGWRSGWRWR
jgi:lipooligosaccharide transport system permease protein